MSARLARVVLPAGLAAALLTVAAAPSVADVAAVTPVASSAPVSAVPAVHRVVPAVAPTPTPALAPARPGFVRLEIVTVPGLPEARFAVDGRPVSTDPRGVVRIEVSQTPARHQVRLLNPTIVNGDKTAKFARWWGQRDRDATYLTTIVLQPLRRDLRLQVAFSTSYRVRFTFTDQASRRIDPDRVKVTSVTFRSSTGDVQTVRGGRVIRLAGARPKLELSRLVARDTDYSLDSVIVDGSNVVDAGRQRFRPSRNRPVSFVLQLRSVRVKAHDFLFGYATGTELTMTYPDGRSTRQAFGPDGEISLDNLARGTYLMRVEGAGYSFTRPVALSRSQVVDLRVVSYLDLAVIGTLLVLTLGGLLVLGRRSRRPPLASDPADDDGDGDRGPPVHGAATVAVLLAAAAVMLPASSARAAQSPSPSPSPSPSHGAGPGRALPVLAYYYIWFDSRSWNRAKRDYPSLGRYSSDDAGVMREHIRSAKAAGITGFLVSWKSTPVNDERLGLLIEVARSERFKLGLVYQGLDFSRQPLPAERIAADLRQFAGKHGRDPVFDIYHDPLVIWSGTWRFSRADIERVTGGVRDRLEVLASEKDVEGYQRVADVVDGNAYYWSSVNPDRNPGYGRKLAAMAAAVHAHDGLWVAPFAPGFDARLVGGTSVVDRQDGRTLRREYATALSSSPDALALISWNEFSENTHVEPSQRHGTRYLNVLRDLIAAAPPPLGALAVDSSEPAGGGSPTGFLVLCVVFAFLLITGTGLVLRRRAAPESGPGSAPSHHRHRARRRRALRMFLGLGAIAMLLAGVLRTSEDPSSGVAPSAESSGAPPLSRYLGAVAPLTSGQAVVAAAGDIACPADAAGLAPAERDRPDSCQAKATSEMVIALKPDAVLALGDNQYPNGSLRRFRAAYDKTWGRFKSITHPVPGNHEYGLPGARGYFSYFGEAAGHPDEGWYSFDVASWHLVALNSECDHVGGCGLGSPQHRWLEADLAAHPSRCTLAFWHRPRFSSGTHGDDETYTAFWTTLQRAGAEIVVSGHDHTFERFAPMRADGAPDPDGGIRQFVVGTGGDSKTKFHGARPGSEIRIAGVFGVLSLRLAPDGYQWRFQGGPTAQVRDSGSDRCH